MKGSMVFCFTLASRLITTCPPRCIIPKTGGLSFSMVPRPLLPWSRRRRPCRPLLLTTSGRPLWPAFTEASWHSTSSNNVTVGFFFDPFTQLCRHLLHITAIERQFVSNLLVRQVEAHEIQTQDPDFQRLMMAGKNRVGQIIEACVTVVTLIALTSRFRIIKAALDNVLRRTRSTGDAIGPTQLPKGLITLDGIDQGRDIELHGWTPARGHRMGWHQYRPSSHATTLESNMSAPRLSRRT